MNDEETVDAFMGIVNRACDRLRDDVKEALLALLAGRTPAPASEQCCDGGKFGEAHECMKSPPPSCPTCGALLWEHNPEQLEICSQSPLRVRGGTLEDFKDACSAPPTNQRAQRTSAPVSKPEGLPLEYEHSWGRVYISGQLDIVGQRQMDDGSIEYLCHNEALCNPYYLTTNGKPTPKPDELLNTLAKFGAGMSHGNMALENYAAASWQPDKCPQKEQPNGK